MSFLSNLFGKYGDDIAKAAAKTTAQTAAKATAKTAGKAAAKTLANQVDDVARAAGKSFSSQVDDVAKMAAKKTSKIGTDTASKAIKTANMVDDTATAVKGLKKASKSSATQKLASKAQNEYANSFGGITRNTRQELYGKYRGGGTIGDRLSKANVDVANVADKSSQALSSLGNVQRGLYDYADNAGISVKLGDTLKNSGLSKVQKSRINDILGIDLDQALNTKLSASEAEELYRTLRNQAATLANSSDASQQLVGKNLQKVAKDISAKIDATIEPIKGSYGLGQKTIAAMQEYGDDPNVIRNISKMGDNFTVADLRGEMQPWMVAQEGLIGNKLSPEDTLKIAGIDTGMPNYIKKGVQGVGELPLKAKAALEGSKGLQNAALIGGGVIGGGLLGSLLSGGGGNTGNIGMGNLGAMEGNAALGGKGAGLAGVGGAGTTASTYQGPTINGFTYDDLEQGYFNAIQAGDTYAAKYINDLMDMLDAKIERQEKLKSLKSSSGSDIAAKQQGAINVLNNLMQNFEAKGTLSGNLTQFMNMLTGGGYNPQVYAYDTGSRGSLGTIIKALGDTGALSEGDQQRALQLLPSTTDSPAAAQQKYQQLLQILYSAGTK